MPLLICLLTLYRRWQRKKGWISLYNSDAHSAAMVGLYYNLVDTPAGPPADEKALIRLLRTAPIRPFEDRERIRAAINGR